jgi:hypothetical protein
MARLAASLVAAAAGVLIAASAAMVGPALLARAQPAEPGTSSVGWRLAAASDAPIVPVQAQLSSPQLKSPLAASVKNRPDVLQDLVNQVNWVSGRRPDPAPDAKTLGPKFTLLLTYSNNRVELWELYPYAATGPYIFQPSPQPGNRKITPTWHLGRLSMVDVLCAQGVSPPGTDDCKLVEGRGAGGGAGEVLTDRLDKGIGQWRDSLYTVALTIGACGLLVFLVTYRIHRRTG